MSEQVYTSPIVGDGFVDVPKEGIAVMDPTIAKMLDVNLLNQQQEFTAQANRTRAGDSAVAELVRNVAVSTQQLVGAKAAQTLETSAISREILQARAVTDQPGLPK